MINVRFQNDVNIEYWKGEMSHVASKINLSALEACEFTQRRFPYILGILCGSVGGISILFGALSYCFDYYMGIKIALGFLLVACMCFLYYKKAMAKINESKRTFLLEEIGTIKDIEDIARLLEKEDCFCSESCMQPLYFHEENIYTFAALQKSNIIDIDVSQKMVTIEKNNGDVKVVKICGEVIQNTHISDIVIVLTNNLAIKIMAPYEKQEHREDRKNTLLN